MERMEILINDGTQLLTHNDYIGNAIKRSKEYYEKEILESFIDYIPENAVIYDIGANIGNHTIYFSKYTNPKKIYSFEPVSESYNLIVKNIEVNKIEKVELFNIAIGDRKYSGKLIYNMDNLGATFVNSSKHGETKIEPIDSLKLEKPDFIKIDVEGFEYKALKGMLNTLENSNPIIWIEVFKDNYERVNGILKQLGYIPVDRWLDNYIYKKYEKENVLDNIYTIFEKPIKRMNNKIHEINLKYRNLSKRSTELSSENKQLIIKSKKFENEIDKYNLLVNELKNNNRLLAKENENRKEESESIMEIKQEINQLREKVALFEAKETLTQELLHTLKAEIDNSLKEKKEFQIESMNLMREFMQIYNSNNNRLQEKVEELKEKELKINFLQDGIKEYKKKEYDLTSQIKEYNKANSKQDEIIKMLESKSSSYEYEIVNKDRYISSLEENLAEANNTISLIEKSNADLENDINITKQDSEQKIDELEKSIEFYKKKVNEIEIQKYDIDVRIQEQIVERLQLLSQEEDFIYRLEKLGINNKKLEIENEKLKNVQQELKQKYELTTKRYTALKNSKLGKMTIKYWTYKQKSKNKEGK